MFFRGGSTVQSLTSRTTWQDSPLVAGPNAITLFIKPGELMFSDFAGLDLTAPTIEASYLIDLRLNGASVFSSEAVLRGGKNGHLLTESGTDLGGTYFTDVDYPSNIQGYRFDSLIANIPLGVLATTDVVEYVMQARVSGPGFETGGRASIGDPFDLAGGGSSISFAGPVPEPSSYFMFGGRSDICRPVRRRRRCRCRAWKCRMSKPSSVAGHDHGKGVHPDPTITARNAQGRQHAPSITGPHRPTTATHPFSRPPPQRAAGPTPQAVSRRARRRCTSNRPARPIAIIA